MIDEISSGTSNSSDLFIQSEDLLPKNRSLPTSPLAEEKMSSLRSSNRKLRALHVQNSLISASSSGIDEISADSKKYFFEKMKKKGIHGAEKVYDQYLEVGFSPKAAIALTDRRFFQRPHEKDHGNYLKKVIGNELFKKEQASRKGKKDWIYEQIPDEKIQSAVLKALEESAIKSKIPSGKSKNHKYHKLNSIGGYLLGIGEIIAGGALIVTGGALEIATCGGFTIGLGVTIGAGASLIGLGIATAAEHAKDISIPKFPEYDLLDFLNKSKEKPKKWDEPGSPPVRGDLLIGDGKTSPGQGFDKWRGFGNPGSNLGGWVRGDGKSQDSLHPDLDHGPPHGPHWDYHGPGFGDGARIYPDGTWEPKQ